MSFGIGIETVQDENRSGTLRLPPQGPSGCDNRHERRSRGVLGEGRAEWEMAAASLHDDVLLNSEEPHERDANGADADFDSLVGSLESTKRKVAAEGSSGLGHYRWPKWRSPANGVGYSDGDGKI